MQRNKKLVMLAGLVLFIVGIGIMWRALHPPLPPDEQIKANLDDLRLQIENRNVRGVTRYFTENFSWQNTPRKELVSELKGAFFQGRDIQLHLTNERVNVQGNSATASGHYTISFRAGPDAPATTQSGDFQTNWENQNGAWKISKATGGENVGNFGG